MSFLNRNEIKYIIGAGIFGFVFFGLLLNYLIKLVGDSNPVMQFAVFNVGIWLYFFIFLKSFSTSTSSSVGSAIGLLLLFIALDIILPEYHVTMTGELVTGAILGASTSDYVAGYFLQSVGIKGFFLYLGVYAILPIILLLGSAKILPNFVRRL